MSILILSTNKSLVYLNLLAQLMVVLAIHILTDFV